MKNFSEWLESRDFLPVLPLEKNPHTTRPPECPWVGNEYSRILRAIDVYVDAGWTFEDVKEKALSNDNFLKILADKALVKPELVKNCIFGLRGKNDPDEDEDWDDES
jgi:hypothetical protein